MYHAGRLAECGQKKKIKNDETTEKDSRYCHDALAQKEGARAVRYQTF